MVSVETPTPYDPAIKDVQMRFARLRSILDERESILITYVTRLKCEYLGSQSQIQDLLRLREFVKSDTRDNKIMMSKIAEIDRDVSERRSQLSKKAKTPPVYWGSVGYPKLCDLLNEIQFEPVTHHPINKVASDASMVASVKIENKECSVSRKEDRYRRMQSPAFKGGKLGDGSSFDDLCYPNHLSIDESTQNIYVSDFRQNCIVVFDSKANLINKYSSDIRFPRAIACKNDTLYLIENSHSMQHLTLKKFSLSPEIAHIPSKRVKPPADLLIVSAFDVSSKEDWYICNRQANKIHCFSNNSFSSFLTSASIHHPTAIRVREFVYVLESHSDQASSLKTFSLQGVVMQSIPLYSIVEPLYFDIDIQNNVIVSDSVQDSVVIFERSGNLYHRISSSENQSITRPKGVAVSSTGNLVVVTNNQEGTLLVF